MINILSALLRVSGWLLLFGMGLLIAEQPVVARADERAPHDIATDAVARVWVSSAEDLAALQLDYNVWDHGNHRRDNPYVLVQVTPADYAALRQSGRKLELDLAQTSKLNQPRQFDPLQRAGIPGYGCYRTVEETYATLDTLNAAYPELVTLVDIGDTWQKTQSAASGYDVRALVITNEAIGGTKPKYLIMAATHAREYATAEMATRFAEYVLQQYGVDPDVTWLVDYFELHIVPQANPDGRKVAESADIWHRKNTNTTYCSSGNDEGVDLNRNMSWAWQSGTTNQCADTFAGLSALSEPENIAIANYAQLLFPDLRGEGPNDPAPDSLDGVFITIHSFGEYVLPTWAYTDAMSGPNAVGIYTLGRKMGYYNDYYVCGTGDANCLGAASGTHDDYVYGELGVPAYTLELGNAFHESCINFESTIYPDNLNALLYTYKATRRPYQTPAGPEVVNLLAEPWWGGEPGGNVVTVTYGSPISLTVTVDDTRYDSNGNGMEPTQAIAAARYSVNAPSWVSGTVSVTMTAVDGAFDASVEEATAFINTIGWSEGRHTIFVEGQDADGNWGVPSAYFVNVSGVPTSATFALLPIVMNGSAETRAIIMGTAALSGATLASLRRIY